MAEPKRRQSERYDFTSLLEYRLLPKTSSRSFKAITINVGNAGFCSYLQTPLTEGQEVEIKKNTLPFSCRRAVVRWVNSVDDIYVAGFECK